VEALFRVAEKSWSGQLTDFVAGIWFLRAKLSKNEAKQQPPLPALSGMFGCIDYFIRH
jgi:hypothetical protein